MSDAPTPKDAPLSLSLAQVLDPVCDQFEAAWKVAGTAGPRPRIEEFLATVSGPQRAALLRELISLDLFYRRRAGESPTVEEYGSRFPELDTKGLADAIMAHAPPVWGSPGGSTKPLQPVPERDDHDFAVAEMADAPTGIPRRVGEYRILRQIGAGGMGQVYEAVQESLGRHVALKVLPLNPLAVPVPLERFRREAKAAAKLHHTNIVPVFGFGEQGGLHYYAMQFIDGRSLDRVIADLRLQIADFPEITAPSKSSGQAGDSGSGTSSQPETGSFRSVAQLGVQAAEALDYAHRQGILHRDIKPANLLLDTAGTVWLTDFGLAKVEDTEELTSPGDVVGTLRYLAPERFEGHADPRSDVYGLGVTLYELLTLRPAFDDRNRARLMERIQRGNPPSPRRLDRRIPRDLETITLKAIAKEPGRRYATAAELADDLRRFLADRPIRARRTPVLERAWRWCRRNPALAGLTASVASLLLFISLGSLVAALRLEAAGRQTTEKLYQSLVAQARAGRTSRRIGQRFESLKAVTEAVQIARTLKLPEDRFLELRNEAIACLALPDLSVAREWNGWPAGALRVDFDGTLQRYARLDNQGKVSIRRAANDEEIYHLSGATGAKELYLSPNGEFLFVGAEVWKVWKLAGQEPSLILKELPASAHDFSPDNRQLAVATRDGSLRIYDLASAIQVRELQVGAEPKHLAYHPTQRRLAIAFLDRVEVRDLETGNRLANFPLEPNLYAWASWHPDGKVLAAVGGDGIIYLWDAATGKQITKLEGTKGAGIRFTFSHAGDLLASTGWEAILRVWDPQSGKELFHKPALMTVLHFSPDDRFLAGEFTSNRLRVWHIAPGREHRTLVRLPAGAVYWLMHAVSPDGRLLAVGTAEGFGLRDLATGKELRFIPTPMRTLPVQFEPSGALLTNGLNGLWRWPVRARSASAESLHLGPPHLVPLGGSSHLPALSKDGRVIASPRGWGALVLHADHPGQPVTLAPHSDVRQVAVSPDGHWVATSSHDASPEVKVWDARTGKLSKSLFAGVGQLAAFSPNGQWLAACGDAVRVWEVGSWKERHRFEAMRRIPMTFSPDSKMVAFETGEGVVRLMDMQAGKGGRGW